MNAVTEPLLQEMTRRLVDEFQPERVFLFGSRAWGTPGRGSDVDLMVIVPSSNETAHERAVRALRALRGVGVPKDVIVQTRDVFERRATVFASLESKIVRRGKLLYG